MFDGNYENKMMKMPPPTAPVITATADNKIKALFDQYKNGSQIDSEGNCKFFNDIGITQLGD
jgi:hypothetical protein